MVIAHQLEEGDSFHVIESCRLSLKHTTLPIAFVITDRDLNLAQSALHAGVTEIFLRTERESLMSFVGDCATVSTQAPFSGSVLLVEDSDAQALFIEHLCNALGMSVDRAQDVDSATELFQRNPYQIVITDVVLKGTKSGISFVKTIRQNHALRQPILVISGFEDLPRRLLALKCGADDFLGKPFAPEEFVWRVRRIMQGYADRDLGHKDQATPALAARSPEFKAQTPQLSPRENEICSKLLTGMSDQNIASALGISFWTVRSHIQHIFAKTGALNRRELMARFITLPGKRD